MESRQHRIYEKSAVTCCGVEQRPHHTQKYQLQNGNMIPHGVEWKQHHSHYHLYQNQNGSVNVPDWLTRLLCLGCGGVIASLNMKITDSSSIHITIATSLNLVIVREYLMAFAVLGPFLVQDLLPAWVHSNQSLFIILSSDIPVCVGCGWVCGWVRMCVCV